MLPIVMALVKKVARYDKIFSEGQAPQVAVIYKGNQVGGKKEIKTQHSKHPRINFEIQKNYFTI
jgi:hypothetical protein